MIETHKLDTPIDRASIDKLPVQDMLDYVDRIRVRRLAPLAIYEAGVIAKEKAAKGKAAEDLKKRLDQFVAANTTALNAIAKMEKYAQEIQGLRIAVGDLFFNQEK